MMESLVLPAGVSLGSAPIPPILVRKEGGGRSLRKEGREGGGGRGEGEEGEGREGGGGRESTEAAKRGTKEFIDQLRVFSCSVPTPFWFTWQAGANCSHVSKEH